MNAIKDQHGRIWKFDFSFTRIIQLMMGSGSKVVEQGSYMDGKFTPL